MKRSASILVKKIAVFLLAAAVLIPAQSQATSPYSGYIWNTKGDAPSINGYTYFDSIDGLDMPSGPLKAPEDLFIDHDDTLYIVDGGNNRVIHMDRNHNLLKIFGDDDGPGKLNGPKGVYVKKDGTVYVADTLNRRVALFDKDGTFNRELGTPQSPLLGSKFVYSPSKLVVDKRDYLIVASDGTSTGLLQIDPKGDFKGFYGANMVEFSWKRLFIKLFATEEQKAQLAKVRPMEFSNLYQDEEGFIYTTTLGAEYNQVKRLSAVGVDTYNPDWRVRTNRLQFGDKFTIGFSIVPSFVDLTVDDKGVITALDQTTGKAFQYDKVRNLLFIFGGNGDQNGLFKTPVSIDQTSDGMMYIVDRTRNRIDRFRKTPFAELVHHASELYVDGRYEEAKQPWHRIMELNSNYDLAYSAVGKALQKEERWKEAMAYFKQGRNQGDYSASLREYRKEYMREHFSEIVFGLVIVFLFVRYGARWLRRLWKRRIRVLLDAKKAAKGGQPG